MATWQSMTSLVQVSWAAWGESGKAATASLASDGATKEAANETNLSGFSQSLDRLTDISDPTTWWHNVTDFLTNKGVELAMNLLAALVILVVGRWVAQFLRSLVGRVATQAKVDETLVKFVTNLVYAAMLAFVVLSALNRIGVDTTSFTAVVAAAGLAIGFALQGSLANFAAGVLLIVFKPFRVGDSVQAGGSAGTVVEIQIFSTLIRTDANALIFVPNSAITSATITNFSAEHQRRIDLVIKCGYDNDLRQVKAFLVELLAADERVLQLPPPTVAVDQLGDNAISLIVQPWVRSEYYGSVRTDLLEAIKVGFEQRSIRLGGAPKPPPPAEEPGLKIARVG